MKILITGASGYVGREFIKRYQQQHEFYNFSLLNDDISTIKLTNIDSILHCAALVHQKTKLPYEEYHRVNTEYSIALAKLAKENGVKQFVFVSTIAVYNKNLEYIDENSSCNPATYYGKSKLAAERALLVMGDDNFCVTIIRPPMIYGHQAPGNMSALAKLIKKTSVLPFGDINNRRTFVSIQNLSHMIHEVILQQKNGIFLAGDDKSLSTTALIELIGMNLGKRVHLLKIPILNHLLKIILPTYYQRLFGNLEIDNSASREKLKITNPLSVEEGIRQMIKREEI